MCAPPRRFAPPLLEKEGKERRRSHGRTRQHAFCNRHGRRHDRGLARLGRRDLAVGTRGLARIFRRGPADRRRQPDSRSLPRCGDHLRVPARAARQHRRASDQSDDLGCPQHRPDRARHGGLDAGRENRKGRGLRRLAHRRDLAARGARNAHRPLGSVDRAADEQRPAARPARARVEKPDARGFRRVLAHRAVRLRNLLLLVHRMRRFAAILLASLAALWPALPAAQHGAKPEINSPFLVNPDVARWKKGFENEDREVYRKRNEILAATGVKPGMAVADVGAGTGLFTMLFAQAVSPSGRVYAVDISRAFIEHIGERAKAEGLDNVTTILTKGTETELPEASVDLVYTCDTYHHFEHPGETLQSIRRALRPGGRMVVIDFQKIPGETHQQRIDHTRADKQTAIREIEAAGFRFVEEKKLMRENYFVVFQRP